MELKNHCMVVQPFLWLERLTLRSIDTFVFHYEAIENKHDIAFGIEKIKQKGCRVGIALSPKTSVDVLFPLLTNLDHILIMSVEPGFSGQRFMPEVLSKVETLVQYKKEYNLLFDLAMDGGITHLNIGQVARAGVTQCGVAAIFNHQNPVLAVEQLQNCCC